MSARDAKLTPVLVSGDAEEPDYPIQALLAAIVESSDDAIVSKTLDGRIRSWNAGAMRLFGYTAEEVIGKPITIIIPPELHEEERHILQKLQRGERIDHFETTRVTRDGRRIPISLSVSPVRDSRGVVIGASKVARDISERKRAEQILRESERLLSVEADALAKLNESSSRLWRSRTLQEGLDVMLAAAIELLGADQGHVQLLEGSGKDGVLRIAAQRGLQPDFLEHFREVSADDDCPCGRALRSGQRIIIEDVEADAPRRALAAAADYRAVVTTPLMGGDGKPLGMLSAHFRSVHRPGEGELRRLDLYMLQASDFIQRCRMEHALRQNQEALREADRRKNEFLALLAHELRNPLAPIRYALAAGRKGGRTLEQQKRAEEVIERQVAHMSRLVDDLLDVSRITHGTLELKKSRTELTLVLGAAIEAARPILDSKHHTLSIDLPEQTVQLEADPVRLAQVFSNLLINAAKYTDAGGSIELRATCEAGAVVVAVCDNGMGISADMMPRLFTFFSQAHTALGRSEGGLGVGLALAQGLVALHGGRVEARSDGPGRGSEFIVRLPLRVPASEVSQVEVSADGPAADAGLKILVVDDSRDAADTCATVLELSGHEVLTAYNGRRALELARTFRPHALLLDIGLPDVNGYELARAIRAAPWAGGMVLIAVTGWGQGEDRRRALEAGFDHHLTKPIAAETLESLLQSLDTSQPDRKEYLASGKAGTRAGVPQPR
jgi:PAS domain S-box-containing protein